jgi:N-hydroxyarylamine O-acetyltransferase
MITDLDAYLRRIGFNGRAKADLATLQSLTLLQPLAIPFENLDAWLGRAVTLDPLAVEDKLVQRRRGGWCFEQNLLLGNALRTIGFEVDDLAARVLWGRSLADRPARTHRLLRVKCEGTHWLADAGFGALTPTGALDMDSRVAQSTPLEQFRLRPLEEDLLLEAAPVGAVPEDPWLPIYRFDQAKQWDVDFEAANFQLSRDSASRFVQVLVVNRATREGRWTLRDLELEFRAPSGKIERRRLEGATELLQVLEQIFEIETELASIAARLGT